LHLNTLERFSFAVDASKQGRNLERIWQLTLQVLWNGGGDPVGGAPIGMVACLRAYSTIVRSFDLQRMMPMEECSSGKRTFSSRTVS